MLFMMLFAVMVNRVYVCIMIFAVIDYVIRYDIHSVWQIFKTFCLRVLGKKVRKVRRAS